MGYYSTMDECNFVSNISAEEITKKWHEKLKENKDNYEDEGFEFRENGEKDGRYQIEVVPWNEEYYGKFYEDEEIAKFISTVIAQGDYTILSFTGEDGAKWGYFIRLGKIRNIEYVAMVDGVKIDDTPRNTL